MIDNNRNLFYLNELPDYKISPNDCDVRGWEVIDSYCHVIGKVESLLVNKQSERVVYLEVELDKTLLDNYNTSGDALCTGVDKSIKDGSVYIVLPVGMVNLNEEKMQVISTQICCHNIGKTRVLSKGYHIDPDYVGRV